jgi:UTP--glucose-1-phosphate uridylyltransferase
MQAIIKKAVFPVAGLGTRFLPATKANPKEMLPIVDKPLIQYAVEEAVEAGITQLIFVTSLSKRSIEDHFDSNYELEAKLVEGGKNELVTMVRNIIPRGVNCVYVRQQEPLGLGHAVLCARDVVGKEPFAVLLADDLIDNGCDSCLKQMLHIYKKINSSVLAIQSVTASETEKYGIVGLENKSLAEGEYAKITTIIEKPKANHAPSNFASIGRYILTPQVFDLLESTSKGAIGEIQLTDGIDKLLCSQDVYGYAFRGCRYDCGSKLGYLQATVKYGLKHPEIGKLFAKYLDEVLNSDFT